MFNYSRTLKESLTQIQPDIDLYVLSTIGNTDGTLGNALFSEVFLFFTLKDLY